MTHSKSVLVTGSTGFLGTAISGALAADGWNVIRCARKPAPGAGPGWVFYDLAKPVPEGLLAAVDVVIHAAYVPAKDEPRDSSTNVNGARRLIDAARKTSARFIFISSLSATQEARSQYGREKFAIEGLLDSERDLVVRPGLVLGAGGIFERLLKHVRSGRAIPLVDGGQQPMQTIHVDDLVAAIRALLLGDCSGTFVLAEPASVTYAKFFRTLAARIGVKARFIPVPSWLLLTFAGILQAARIPSPVDRDNVLGLLDMRFVDTATSGRQPLPPFRSFDESVESLFAPPSEDR